MSRRILLFALVFFVVSSPASALSQPGIAVREGVPVSRNYPPITGSNPNGCPCDPPTCAQINTCDTIPLTIRPPDGVNAGKDYLVRITLFWDFTKVGGQAPANDLHLRVYAGSTAVGVSNTAEPEVVMLLNPAPANYNITVMNAQGANTGYTLKGELEIAEPEGGFGEPPPDNEFTEPGGGPLSRKQSVEETTPGPSAARTLPDVPSLIGALASADPTLSGLASEGGRLQGLLAGPSDVLNIEQDAGPRPGPPTGLAVLAWAVALPVGLFVAAAFLIRARGATRLERIV